jgi:2-amino-4-hydroxy-6-hydroxymethyldihydropteridine diphosphokinase
VYLGLGTNEGDRGRNLEEALHQLTRVVDIVQTSSVYETEPVGFKEQGDFWNIVIRATTDLPAPQLMEELIGIETAMGRTRTFKNAPRNIDIDLLLYDDVVMSTPSLELPHPRMQERAFVLRPLIEIAPDIADPRTRERYADVLQRGGFERTAKL